MHIVKWIAAHIDRWRQLETRTWSWVDCRSQTLAATLWKSAVWLSICSIKCLALRFVIALRKRWNFASEYTLDLALQVSDKHWTGRMPLAGKTRPKKMTDKDDGPQNNVNIFSRSRIAKGATSPLGGVGVSNTRRWDSATETGWGTPAGRGAFSLLCRLRVFSTCWLLRIYEYTYLWCHYVSYIVYMADTCRLRIMLMRLWLKREVSPVDI